MAKGDDGEIVAWNESKDNVREEVNHRTAKYGKPRGHSKIISMPPNDKYRENYVKIFGHD